MSALMLALRHVMACSTNIRERAVRMGASLRGYHQFGQLLLYELVHPHKLGNAFLYHSTVGLYC